MRRPFQYTPLDDANSFRFIVLHPGDRRDEIHCQMVHSTHLSNPHYEALSYTWGSPENPKICYLNGQATEIQHNLHEAFLHLRSPWEARTLWVDAICIDQSNIRERNHQVKLMGSIYSRADSVIIWLGPKSTTSAVAMDWIESSSMRHRSSLGIRERLDLVSPAKTAQLQTRRWIALRNLCIRGYWYRVWIVQEVVLAKRLKIQCGNMETKWDGLANILDDFDKLFRPKISRGAAHKVQSSLPAQLHALRKMHQIAGCTLGTLLKTTRNSKCTDPRDKVYALLGLAADCHNGKVEVDYSKGMKDVYVSLWNYYVRDRSASKVVHGSQFLERLVIESNLTGVEDNYLPQEELDVTGHIEGNIIYAGQPWASRDSAEAWYRELDRLYQSQDENRPILVEKNYQRFCSALYESAGGDAELIEQPESRASVANRQHLHPEAGVDMKSNVAFESFELPGSSFWDRDNRYAEYKRHNIFIGSHGQFGIVPDDAKIGDEICQFQESDVTVIVRRSGSLGVDETTVIGKALLSHPREVALDGPTPVVTRLFEEEMINTEGCMARVQRNLLRHVRMRISSVDLRLLTRPTQGVAP